MTAYNCAGEGCDERLAARAIFGQDLNVSNEDCIIAMRDFETRYGEQDGIHGAACGTAIIAFTNLKNREQSVALQGELNA